MAWSFGDGFDLYTATSDMVNGYWDSGTNPAGLSLVAGRFSGSRGLQTASVLITYLSKTSSVNDAVHHICIAFLTTQPITGSTSGVYLQLLDGTTAQCTIVFRSDGAILLQSGAAGGTTLATYTGASPVQNIWYQFEFEVVINNTTGSFKVRKNGNNVDDHSTTGLNTRGGTANNYANKLLFGNGSSNLPVQLDDLFWKSDASSVAWLGDIRCQTRMPASDASVTWSRTSTGVLMQTVSGGSAATLTNTVIRLQSYTLTYTGTLTAFTLVTNASASGNMKAAIWADNAGVPGAVLASAGPITTTPAGNNVFTLGTPLSVTAGQKIWIGGLDDTSAGTWNVSGATSTGGTASGTYATFPQANPVRTADSQLCSSITYGSTPANWQAVGEAQLDTTSYVYSSTVNNADLYGISPITSTPTSVIAVTTRSYFQKSDAATRSAAVQTKSGSTTVASPTLVLSTSGWQWAWRTDLTDPATGAAWMPAAVNTVQVGPKVIA